MRASRAYLDTFWGQTEHLICKAFHCLPADLSNYDAPTILRALAHAEKALGVEVTIHEDAAAIQVTQEHYSNIPPFGDLEKFQRKYHLTDEQWLRKYGYLSAEEPQVESAQSDEAPPKAPHAGATDGSPLQGCINTWDLPAQQGTTRQAGLPEGTVDVTAKRPRATDTSTGGPKAEAPAPGERASLPFPPNLAEKAQTTAKPEVKAKPALPSFSLPPKDSAFHTARQPKSTQFTPTDDYYAQIPLAMRHGLEQMYRTEKGNLDVPFDAKRDNESYSTRPTESGMKTVSDK